LYLPITVEVLQQVLQTLKMSQAGTTSLRFDLLQLSIGYVLLYEHECCYILNQDSGSIRLEVGPQRIVLKGNEKLESGPHKTTVLTRDQYCVILNPFDPKT
jgi:hypothetical protein